MGLIVKSSQLTFLYSVLHPPTFSCWRHHRNANQSYSTCPRYHYMQTSFAEPLHLPFTHFRYFTLRSVLMMMIMMMIVDLYSALRRAPLLH